MKKEIILSREEVEVALYWNHWLRDELGSCDPIDGRCRSNYRPEIPQCRLCRRLGEFLEIGFKEG